MFYNEKLEMFVKKSARNSWAAKDSPKNHESCNRLQKVKHKWDSLLNGLRENTF